MIWGYHYFWKHPYTLPETMQNWWLDDGIRSWSHQGSDIESDEDEDMEDDDTGPPQAGKMLSTNGTQTWNLWKMMFPFQLAHVLGSMFVFGGAYPSNWPDDAKTLAVLGFSISSLYWISSWLGCVAMRFWDLRFWHQKKRFVGCPCSSYRVCWFASRVSRSKWRCGVIVGRLEEAGNETSKGPKPSRSRYM